MPDSAARYLDLDRSAWSRLGGDADRSEPAPLGEDELARLAGLGEPVDLDEVREVYLPLSRLLVLQAATRSRMHEATMAFVGASVRPSPFVVAIAGSVAAGKSTTARVLRELLARSPGNPSVALVPTDGFLLPNAELARRGIMTRKGWPESYDTRALIEFLAGVKAGEPEVSVPVYSHLTYDLVPGASVVVRRPDILLVEGLTVLQPASSEPDARPRMVASDFFDSSVYVDAAEDSLLRWYVERFLALRTAAFSDPASYFHRFAGLDDDQARETAAGIWHTVNEPNLRRNIAPTRARASVVLEKDDGHRVRRVRLRPL